MNQKKVVLVFRDKLLLDSETFISRSYEAFSEFQTIYLCTKLGWSHNKITDRKIVISNGIFRKFLFSYFGYTSDIKKIKKLNPSIIHAHFGKSGALALPIAKQLKIPLVITFHGGDITKFTHSKKTFFPRVFQRRLSEIKKYTSNFFAVSDFIGKKLAEKSFPKEKILTHYLGIKIETPIKINEHNNRLFFAGRFVEKKGIDTLISAVKVLKSNSHNIQLDLAGSGPLENYYKKITKDIPEINYLGWLSKEKIEFYMQNSLAVVVPSRVASNGDCEGLPTIILEALSNSCLVIASNHSGIPEIIKPNITGFMFRENDHNELANLIIKAKGITVEDRNNMIDEGQRVLKEKFNSYDQSIKFEKSLSQIVASYGSGGGI